MKKLTSLIFTCFASSVFAQSDCLQNLADREHNLRLRNQTEIKYLSLNSCQIEDQDFLPLFSYLEKHPYIKGLDLQSNHISNVSLSRLAEKPLLYLDLSNNNIGDEGAAILSRNASFTMLMLPNNNIGWVGAEALSKNNNLDVLDLSNNNIGDLGVPFLAKLTNLTELNISKNQISDVGMMQFGQTSLTSKLNYLWLNDNNLRALTAVAISKLPLKELCINHNLIGDEGAYHLSRINSLIFFEAAYNNIGDRGAMALANLPNLLVLRLPHNNIDDQAAGALLHAPSQRFCYLDVSYNRFTKLGLLVLNKRQWCSLKTDGNAEG